MSDATKLAYAPGILTIGGEQPTRARLYYGDDEAAPIVGVEEAISDATHTRWLEADGVVGIRRGTDVSVGASRAYTAKYDEIDWN